MKTSRKQRAAFCLAILSIILSLVAIPAQANVGLVYFEASYEDGEISLTWETSTELNTAAFIVKRGLSQGQATEVIDQLVAVGDSISGSNYSTVDENVQEGVTYWYALIELTLDNAEVLREELSVTAGQQGGATASITPTSTVTNTSQPGAATLTMTPTFTVTSPAVVVTPSPTSDPAYPGPFNPQPTQPFSPPLGITPTVPSLGSPSPTVENFALEIQVDALPATITLAPLPTIELIFPTPFAQAGRAPLESAAMVYDAEGELVEASESSPNPSSGRVVLIALVLLLWIGLGAWFVFLFRRVS